MRCVSGVSTQFDGTVGNVARVDRDLSIMEASRRMRSAKATQLLVTSRNAERVVAVGLLHAHDIVTRVVAVGLDPCVVTVGDIAWLGGAQGGFEPQTGDDH
jgi:hypothetical protein